MADLQKEGYTLCKSIISQRLMLIRFDKSKMGNSDTVRTEAENLKLEFDKYNTSTRSLAYFIKNNYARLACLIPKTKDIKADLNACMNYIINQNKLRNHGTISNNNDDACIYRVNNCYDKHICSCNYDGG